MKKTVITQTLLKRKFNSLISKQTEEVRLQNKLLKLNAEIEILETEISEFFPVKAEKTRTTGSLA